MITQQEIQTLSQDIQNMSNSPTVYDKNNKPTLGNDDLFFYSDKQNLTEYIKNKKSYTLMPQLQFPPEPWIGNIINPSVILLSGNPGFGVAPVKGNLARIKNLSGPQFKDFQKIFADQLEGTNTDQENYLTHQLSGNQNDPIVIGDGDYWKNVLGKLNLSDDKIKKIAVFEVHPYHTVKYENIGEKNLLPSQIYILDKIKNLSNDKTIFIIMRDRKYWKKNLSEILRAAARDNRLFMLSSAQNNVITENNILLYTSELWDLEENLEKKKNECKDGAYTCLLNSIL